MRATTIDEVRVLEGSVSRAEQILSTAREAFLEQGWDGFGIESIAERMSCSRPLVYKHFPCKEEILLALAIQSKARRVRLYERAVLFAGRPREKMLAIGEVEGLLAARDLPVELLVASTSLRAKTSRRRQDDLKVLDVRAIGLASSVVREAIAAGDLRLPSPLCPEDLLFVLWASRWGASNLRRSDTPLEQAGITNPTLAVDLSLGLLLDGYGWRPLSGEWDYKETRRRVTEEVFPEAVVAQVLGGEEGVAVTDQG
ncbi:MAG TPA: TetR/AcrR family transcriptional regulator [Thermoanaerobaculia bacterium]|nr:TetR/AcrR family transcriptional regulator [Thermoanaerobaculia bacterium]